MAVTGLELITTTYPRTATFILKSFGFYCYVIIYGALAAIAYLLLPWVGDQVTVQGVGLSDPWVKAAIVGFSIKAFLHIRVFTVSTGPGQSFPVGLETFVQLFEPWMLRNLELDHYYRLQDFVTPRKDRCADVAAAQAKAKRSIPTTFTPADRAALEADIDRQITREGVIICYLTYVGIKITKNTFPL